ncbi:hypothetical protein [Streptococcus suis]|nr:hypothetical protein [Streptococcus suis]AGF87523.1 hypothetical protein phi7917_0048 [Streptococcus phage phi7917]QBX30870.1 hypothetical protein Javan578_0015 [Streptococcus phage Javan578]MDN2947912.1 hypothetical protein [Streptococcus suis]MDN2963528.1 hypothetical protein [Streptococcus suis]MDX5045771.1 hypothetical protein [Streptococcus suis]
MTKESKIELLLKSFGNYRKTRDIEHLNDVERILEYDEHDSD